MDRCCICKEKSNLDLYRGVCIDCVDEKIIGSVTFFTPYIPLVVSDANGETYYVNEVGNRMTREEEKAHFESEWDRFWYSVFPSTKKEG